MTHSPVAIKLCLYSLIAVSNEVVCLGRGAKSGASWSGAVNSSALTSRPRRAMTSLSQRSCRRWRIPAAASPSWEHLCFWSCPGYFGHTHSQVVKPRKNHDILFQSRTRKVTVSFVCCTFLSLFTSRKEAPQRFLLV